MNKNGKIRPPAVAATIARQHTQLAKVFSLIPWILTNFLMPATSGNIFFQ